MKVANKDSLRVLRAKADKTQKELSALTGINEMTIVHYEKDVNNLRKAKYETIERMVEALGFEIEDLDL